MYSKNSVKKHLHKCQRRSFGQNVTVFVSMPEIKSIYDTLTDAKPVCCNSRTGIDTTAECTVDKIGHRKRIIDNTADDTFLSPREGKIEPGNLSEPLTYLWIHIAHIF